MIDSALERIDPIRLFNSAVTILRTLRCTASSIVASPPAKSGLAVIRGAFPERLKILLE
ncbi:hypothetical protein [Nocardia sp. NPDC004123]